MESVASQRTDTAIHGVMKSDVLAGSEVALESEIGCGATWGIIRRLAMLLWSEHFRRLNQVGAQDRRFWSESIVRTWRKALGCLQ